MKKKSFKKTQNSPNHHNCFNPKRKIKVLVVTKDDESVGGISNYYRLFFKKYQDPVLKIQRFDIGSRGGAETETGIKTGVEASPQKPASPTPIQIPISIFGYLFQFRRDLRDFQKIEMKDPAIKIVHLNPSLKPLPLIRDGLLLRQAKKAGKKVVVSIRGWRDYLQSAINRIYLVRVLFLFLYKKADWFIVLAEEFKHSLIRWGVHPDLISVSKTMFDGCSVYPLYSPQERKHSSLRFLYLGRIHKSKGVLEIIEAASLLKSWEYSFKLDFFGFDPDQKTLFKLKKSAQKKGVIDFCRFYGYVEGREKYKELSKADVYLLPSWNEGCPTSVLEALACGLFIISTPTGALKEIIKDGKNGRLVRKKDPRDLALKMKWVADNRQQIWNKRRDNRNYAFRHFESKIIINQIKNIYKEMLLEAEQSKE